MSISRRSLLHALWGAPVIAAAAARTAHADQSPSPKISIAEARKIALARVPGEIIKERLKRRKKNDRLVYDLKIKASDAPKHVAKVRVDAENGEIIRVKETRKK